ncbi:uncharacterized protein [Amphiura filiformis]|uniref:uncharacterized protein isoform X2 n=1 Tax=Amphiura filiformis TaxID=82378 RepID=UPI003B21FE16
MRIEVDVLGFSVIVMLISTRRGGALECVRCSDAADSAIPKDSKHKEVSCANMPFITCTPPTSKSGSFRMDWTVLCSKVDGLLTMSHPHVSETRILKKRLCLRMFDKNPIQDGDSHTCYRDVAALNYLNPFKEEYPIGSKFEYNGTVCFCNKDNCNGGSSLRCTNWIFVFVISTLLLFL